MNSTAFEAARSLFEQGLQHMAAGQNEAAEASFVACLQQAPGRVSPLVALGATRLRLQQPEAALHALNQALESDPSRSDAWGHKADALLQLGQPQQALESLQQADAHEPATLWHRAMACNQLGQHLPALDSLQQLLALPLPQAAAWQEHGRTLQCLGRHAEAGASYQQAVQLNPQLGTAWTLYGQWLRDHGQPQQAREAFEAALALGHDTELNQWLLAALPQALAQQASATEAAPAKPPDHYVEQLFDGYATEFEHHLVQKLHYQAPKHLAALLKQHPPRTTGPALDLGCGTGLCAPVLAPFASAVDGVDLSAAMLEQAQRTGLYRHLHRAELVQHLQSTDQRYALLMAADVLIYVGDLLPLLAAAQRVMLPGAVLALSMEEAEAGQDFQLLSSQRYAHGEAYVRHCAAQLDLRVVDTQRLPLRVHEGQLLQGLYMLLSN